MIHGAWQVFMGASGSRDLGICEAVGACGRVCFDHNYSLASDSRVDRILVVSHSASNGMSTSSWAFEPVVACSV